MSGNMGLVDRTVYAVRGVFSADVGTRIALLSVLWLAVLAAWPLPASAEDPLTIWYRLAEEDRAEIQKTLTERLPAIMPEDAQEYAQTLAKEIPRWGAMGGYLESGEYESMIGLYADDLAKYVDRRFDELLPDEGAARDVYALMQENPESLKKLLIAIADPRKRWEDVAGVLWDDAKERVDAHSRQWLQNLVRNVINDVAGEGEVGGYTAGDLYLLAIESWVDAVRRLGDKVEAAAANQLYRQYRLERTKKGSKDAAEQHVRDLWETEYVPGPDGRRLPASWSARLARMGLTIDDYLLLFDRYWSSPEGQVDLFHQWFEEAARRKIQAAKDRLANAANAKLEQAREQAQKELRVAHITAARELRKAIEQRLTDQQKAAREEDLNLAKSLLQQIEERNVNVARDAHNAFVAALDELKSLGAVTEQSIADSLRKRDSLLGQLRSLDVGQRELLHDAQEHLRMIEEALADFRQRQAAEVRWKELHARLQAAARRIETILLAFEVKARRIEELLAQHHANAAVDDLRRAVVRLRGQADLASIRQDLEIWGRWEGQLFPGHLFEPPDAQALGAARELITTYTRLATLPDIARLEAAARDHDQELTGIRGSLAAAQFRADVCSARAIVEFDRKWLKGDLTRAVQEESDGGDKSPPPPPLADLAKDIAVDDSPTKSRADETKKEGTPTPERSPSQDRTAALDLAGVYVLHTLDQGNRATPLPLLLTCKVSDDGEVKAVLSPASGLPEDQDQIIRSFVGEALELRVENDGGRWLIRDQGLARLMDQVARTIAASLGGEGAVTMHSAVAILSPQEGRLELELNLDYSYASPGRAPERSRESKRLYGNALRIQVTAEQAELKSGNETIAVLSRGQEPKLLEVNGSWRLVEAIVEGQPRRGYLHDGHSRILGGN